MNTSPVMVNMNRLKKRFLRSDPGVGSELDMVGRMFFPSFFLVVREEVELSNLEQSQNVDDSK